MATRSSYDAIVIGAGPNGLAAAITLAQARRTVLLVEARETVGGGLRSAELTLPGFVHDICSAIYPLGVGSPFFQSLPLAQHGLEWIYPPAALAHPLDDGTVAMLERSLDATGATLGGDTAAYRRVFAPLITDWPRLAPTVLGPLRPSTHLLALARFGRLALQSAQGLATSAFEREQARALFGGMAAHAVLPLQQPPSAAAALILGVLGHTVGWPIPRGGAQQFANALASYLRSLGGEIVVGMPVEALEQLPRAGVVLLDVTPRQLLRIAGQHLPPSYRRRLGRFRYGPGVFKVDWALDGPIPWRSVACSRAGTVHLGGTLAEISAAEHSVGQDMAPERPFVLLDQQILFDPTRAPAGQHTAWAYCHVPHGSPVDITARIEAQIERFAPGFRDRVLARHMMGPAALERHNANYIGGDITGGVQDFRQLFTRPAPRIVPYSTPNRRLYICSSSTPPSGGVHGMCGYFAAQAALRAVLRH